MNLVLLAMRRPVTIVVAVIALALCSLLALMRMPVDIFPDLGAPAIYVAQPFGGILFHRGYLHLYRGGMAPPYDQSHRPHGR